jgi:hypothetical protein
MVAGGWSISPLIDDATGPHVHPVIHRYLPAAVEVVRRQGIELSLGTFEELAAVNAANRRSWTPLSPAFDPACGRLAADNAFCILGRDAGGEVAATQAVRVYDWRRSNFHDEAESLRLFYAEPERMRSAAESVTVTAAAAKRVSGIVAYSGAGWYRPDFRHGRLSGLLPRISRALTLLRFPVDFTTAIMHEKAVATGLIARSGHRNVDWEVRTRNFRAGDGRCAFLWLSRSEILDDLQVAALGASEVDVGVLE